ncbi:MAG TPA: hypothetical protein VGL94_16785 [Ktedonobacteraceae bacterium]
MNHIFQVSDEQFTKLAAYAAEQKQTPEALFQSWVSEVIYQLEVSTSSYRKQVHQQKQETNETESLNHPLLQVAGLFAIGEPGWADRHDEHLASTYLENHADEE